MIDSNALEKSDQPDDSERTEENPLSEEKFSKRKFKKMEAEFEQLTRELDKVRSEATEWKNKYYEAFADLDNTRKSLARDHESMLKYRSMSFVEKLLPTLDNFEQAFKVTSEDPKIKNYQVGFKMILSQLLSALADEGVSVIEPVIGQEFDHNTMAACATAPGDKDNLVSSVYLKGYMLKDRLVRPAMVIVSKVEETGASDKAEDEPSADK